MNVQDQQYLVRLKTMSLNNNQLTFNVNKNNKIGFNMLSSDAVLFRENLRIGFNMCKGIFHLIYVQYKNLPATQGANLIPGIWGRFPGER